MFSYVKKRRFPLLHYFTQNIILRRGYLYFLALLIVCPHPTKAVDKESVFIKKQLITPKPYIDALNLWIRKSDLRKAMPRDLIKIIFQHLTTTLQQFKWECHFDFFSSGTPLSLQDYVIISRYNNFEIIDPITKKTHLVNFPLYLRNIRSEERALSLYAQELCLMEYNAIHILKISLTPRPYITHSQHLYLKKKKLMQIKVHTKGRYLIAITDEGEFLLYRKSKDSYVKNFNTLLSKYNYDIDSRTIVLNSLYNTLYFANKGSNIWYVTTKKKHGIFFSPTHKQLSRCLALATAKDKLVASYLDHRNRQSKIVLFNLKNSSTDACHHTILSTQGIYPIHTLVLSPYAQYLISSSHGGKRIWRVLENHTTCIQKFTCDMVKDDDIAGGNTMTFFRGNSLSVLLYLNGYFFSFCN